jgi:predicted ester cyclase
MIKHQRILKLRTALTQAMGTAEEQNKQLVRQFFEAFDRQDTEVMDQLVSSTNYSLHFSGTPPTDWNGTKQFSAAFYSAFPDLRHNIVDMVAEGEDKVAVRLNVTGTHKGEFRAYRQLEKKYLSMLQIS